MLTTSGFPEEIPFFTERLSLLSWGVSGWGLWRGSPRNQFQFSGFILIIQDCPCFLIQITSYYFISSLSILHLSKILVHVMLQLACVLTTGGILLFSSSLCPTPEIFEIIVGRILESKLVQCEITLSSYNIRYSFDSVLGLIFVAIWRKEIILEYVDRFLKIFGDAVGNTYQEEVRMKGDVIVDAPDFSVQFRTAFDKWNAQVAAEQAKKRVMSTFDETDQGKKIKKTKKVDDKEKEKVQEKEQNKKAKEVEKQEETGDEDVCSVEQDSVVNTEEEQSGMSPRERFLMNQKLKSSKKDSKKKVDGESKEKTVREWDTNYNKALSKSDIQKLDRSKSKDSSTSIKSDKYLEEDEKEVEGFVDSDEEIKESTFFKRIVNNIQGVIGNKNITHEDLVPVLNEFKTQLMDKNVAQEVAAKITESVGQTLLETKTKSFTSVQATVKTAIRDALVKILTPAKEINIIADVAKSKQSHKPYVIVFIGVNGVGKSTNLAKVAYMLKNAGFSVMLAACDNFRAGAVEQLLTHGRNLDISVFDKGYKEEPPEIAYQAIKEATQKRIDVVLIDTAGRMQDNTPLMKALARLVEVNKPNLIIFIGEALVGNDAVDQISKFNQALSQFSASDSRREIDGIILSKFDTVDDKVGTAVSMCYTTSKPVLYVGVGQKYPNLRKLNINTIVQSLLS